MEAEFNEQEQEARQEFESQREEIKNKNSEEYNVLRFTLEGLIEELERHFVRPPPCCCCALVCARRTAPRARRAVLLRFCGRGSAMACRRRIPRMPTTWPRPSSARRTSST